MIKAPAPFPHVGSYGLLIDTGLPVEQRRAELARVLGRFPEGRGGEQVELARISLPLREGASSVRTVELTELIDATPLTRAEERELGDLDAALHGRTLRSARQKAAAFRAEKLRERLCYSQILIAELAKLARLHRRQQPSPGGFLPREAA